MVDSFILNVLKLFTFLSFILNDASFRKFSP